MTLLVAQKYEELELLSHGIRLDSESMARAVREYGRKLIIPPDGSFDHLDIIRVENSNPPKWSVDVDCWTSEEGHSDLTLSLTLIETADGIVVEVDDLHVL
jgi:hypothetical protein